jgi:tetratricopeptide (TPR) repeat protein
MKSNGRIPGLIVWMIATMAILPFGTVWGADCEQWAAEAVSVQGEVEAQRTGERQWQAVRLHDRFCPGDRIRVHERSRADLALVNQPLLRLDQNTAIILGGMKEEGTTMAGLFGGAAQLDLLKGAVHFFSRIPRNLEVRTAFVNAGVEGTEFFIRVEEDETFISVFEGKVLAANEAGTLVLTSNQSAEAKRGSAPVYRTVIRPRDAVAWALYYPTVIAPGVQDGLPAEDSQSPEALARRASQLLNVGRVDEANTAIARALSINPQYAEAFALQTIIAVVQNEKEQARGLADRAVAADPQSATARVALSYAQQAAFDLEGARKSVEKAVELEPENGLAWARLAELLSSFGELDKALDAAQRAAALNPDLSRTHTVLGFAYLSQIKIVRAREALTRAIELDQADALPRLGLGLARIREGQLAEGRREIEIAASLDSGNALIRSYLGKAYYEEKRKGLDEREFDIAKELDPNDPTPWFYDAIAKQTTNRPVEALESLEKAIELNDNRAVYRSRLLLDADLAARSASLARVYTDLGFQQLALVEGYKSVNADPTNHSAHRFLADSYAALPRHQIARVSELLQSQLLQPNNITPIQPQLAESKLFLASAGGPGDISFNEFNPLFLRDQLALQLGGIVGGDRTRGGEAVVSGIHKNASFSLGFSRFETDGWRQNAFQEDDIVNLFLQLEFSPRTSLQGEFRNRENERGDVSANFFTDNVFPSLRQEDETETYRIGFRHAFSPKNVLIGNFSYQESDSSLSNVYLFDPAGFGIPLEYPPFVEYGNLIRINQDARGAELQQHLHTPFLKVAAGGGIFSIDQDWNTTDELSYEPFGFSTGPLPGAMKLDIKHHNLYLYSFVDLPKGVNLTIGASGDFFEQQDRNDPVHGENLDRDQFNPKFGITWNPVPSTIIRGAVFRTFKRTLITDQTLEPTQVAGFNQFFDDWNGTRAWVYGGAIDRKFSRSLFGGAEYTYRDLDEVPYFNLDEERFETTEWSERRGRAYLYWTPHRWLALSADYQYEKHRQTEEGNFGVLEVETHSAPLAVRFFHPSGLGAGLKATYWDQKGIFQRTAPVGTYQAGDDSFWLVDATIGYRLPGRRGFISLGATNLFDTSFEYFETDTSNSRIQPGRFVFGKLTLALP